MNDASVASPANHPDDTGTLFPQIPSGPAEWLKEQLGYAEQGIAGWEQLIERHEASIVHLRGRIREGQAYVEQLEAAIEKLRG